MLKELKERFIVGHVAGVHHKYRHTTERINYGTFRIPLFERGDTCKNALAN